jgi:acetyltransferase-like isoleucine patch superfamily enzyme
MTLQRFRKKMHRRWTRFWMRFSGRGLWGRTATRLATLGVPPYKSRLFLAKLHPHGYVSPSAIVHHDDLRMGEHVFIGDRVVIYQTRSGSVRIGDAVHMYADIVVETGDEGTLEIGAETHIHQGCRISAYKGSIRIGRSVGIAPNCGLYPYNHGVVAGELIRNQPLETRGGIVIGDGVWLGFGVVVLDGVRIGNGAVVAAGSVVTRDIPDDAIAVGSPARVVGMRPARGGVAGDRPAVRPPAGDVPPGLTGAQATLPPERTRS